MCLYIGTGFDITGQYGIFTWEITLTGGADGNFDFSFVYDEESSDYHFQTDAIRLGVKGGLEVYGGVGCVLASVGVYGAGSIEYQEEMYPNAEAEHLILAGEIGLKAKLFGKVLARFKIVSGSHDFVFDKKKSWLGLEMSDAEIRQYFLSSGYGSQKGALLKPGANFVWYGENIDLPSTSNDWERDRDFSHLLARDIFPDSHVQIVSSGQNSLSMMNLAFLGNGSGRSDGNNSTLLSSYYNLATEFVSESVPVSDDGTADYEPYLYGNADGVVLALWQNASSAIRPEMTFSEIAETLDLYMAENTSGNSWYPAEQVTSYAGSGKFPSGARIAADSSRHRLSPTIPTLPRIPWDFPATMKSVWPSKKTTSGKPKSLLKFRER